MDNITGYLLIDKPEGWTSHDVIAYLRKLSGIKKIGHAGTLDPFATGLLIVGIGREATKRLDEFKAIPKTYEASLRLGATSDTYDSTGKITPVPGHMQAKLEDMDTTQITKTLKMFLGRQKQIPPMYSAKKIHGQKLYELARSGIEVVREPSEVEIYIIDLVKFEPPIIDIKVKCSTGTYIRTLAHDIGRQLKVGAYCEKLRRTKIGPYSVADAVNPKQLKPEDIPGLIHSLD